MIVRRLGIKNQNEMNQKYQEKFRKIQQLIVMIETNYDKFLKCTMKISQLRQLILNTNLFFFWNLASRIIVISFILK